MAGADIDHDIGGSVFERLMAIRLDMKRGSVGALAGLMRELETLRDFFASATMSAIVDVPFIFVTLTFIGIIGGKLVFVPLVIVPIVIITARSEEHTSELQSLMRISYAVFCLKKKHNKSTKRIHKIYIITQTII